MMPVVQEEVTGCGIASVAALAGVTYKLAQAEANGLGIFAEDRNLWSETDYVRRLLRHFDLSAGPTEVPFSSWSRLPCVALLATKWHMERGRPYWHWAIFWRSPDGPVVLDSRSGLRNPIRTDFWRIKPKWFIEIDGIQSVSPVVDGVRA